MTLGNIISIALFCTLIGAGFAYFDQTLLGPVYRWFRGWAPWKHMLSTSPKAGFVNEQGMPQRAYVAAFLCVLWFILRDVLFGVEVTITLSGILLMAIAIAAIVFGSYLGAALKSGVVWAYKQFTGETASAPTVDEIAGHAAAGAREAVAAAQSLQASSAAAPAPVQVVEVVVPPVVPPAPAAPTAEDRIKSFTG